MIGCFMFVILAPLGYAVHGDWDALSTALLIIGYLSFGIYVFARALVFCGVLKDRVDEEDDDHDENTELQKDKAKNNYTNAIEIDEDSSTDEEEHKGRQAYTRITDENEKYRRRWSYFFCLIVNFFYKLIK